MCLEFTVNYKKTHTNINVKANSNHPPHIKKAVVKGFTERARLLCDEDHLEAELKNIEEVFIANGYTKQFVQRRMKKEQENNKRKKRQRNRKEGNLRNPIS